MRNMVTWPTGAYRDAGEGGMYAYLVVAEPMTDGPEGRGEGIHKCIVDSYPMLTRPDVLITRARPQIFEPHEHDDHWHGIAQRITERLPDGMDAEKRHLRNATGEADLSVPLLFVAYLGSTNATLWDDRVNDWFEVGYEHLTQAGKILHDTALQAYEIEPLILTFLDT